MDCPNGPLRRAEHALESHGATSRGVRTFAGGFLGSGTELAVQAEETERCAALRGKGRQQRSEIIRGAVAFCELRRPENAARRDGLDRLGAETADKRHTRIHDHDRCYPTA